MTDTFVIIGFQLGNGAQSEGQSDRRRAANGIVSSIRSKAMPVLLTTSEEWDVWLRAPWTEAVACAAALPDDPARQFDLL